MVADLVATQWNPTGNLVPWQCKERIATGCGNTCHGLPRAGYLQLPCRELYLASMAGTLARLTVCRDYSR